MLNRLAVPIDISSFSFRSVLRRERNDQILEEGVGR
jgi:hypothetical protein